MSSYLSELFSLSSTLVKGATLPHMQYALYETHECRLSFSIIAEDNQSNTRTTTV